MSRFKYRNILPFKFLSKILNRDLKLLFAATVIGVFGDGLYFYILPLYVMHVCVGGVLYDSSPCNPFLVFIVATALLSFLVLTKIFD